MTDVLDIPITELPIIELPPEDTRTSTVKVLDYMIELLGDRNNWCRHAYARDKDGEEVKWDNERAVHWCMLGAHRLAYARINRVKFPSDTSEATEHIVNAIFRVSNSTSIPGFNDATPSHASVMAVLYSARDAALKDSA